MRNKNISVIGLGFVGFPTACILANCKNKKKKNIFKVFGVDQNISEIKKKCKNYLNKKIILSNDKKLNNLIRISLNKNLLNFTDSFECLTNSGVIIVSVSFDFSKNTEKQQFKNLNFLFEKICSKISKKTLVVVETTLPPGTCDKVIIPLMKKKLKKRNINFDKDIYFGFSFERIMPGNFYLDSVINNFRCYSGTNATSKLQIKKFLKKFINYKRYPLDELHSIKDCESAKILENSYRAINIAFIDEWTKYSINEEINLNSIIDAIKKRSTHSNIMRPGLGVGGYCLTKDPSFMNTSSRRFNRKKINFPIINESLKINNNMPNTSILMLKKKIKNLKKKKFLIMGLAYKKDVADKRFSPSKKILDYLKNNKIKFSTHDPFFNGKIDFSLNKFDVILLCVDHTYYKKISYKYLSSKPHYIDLNKVLTNEQIMWMRRKKFKLDILGGD